LFPAVKTEDNSKVPAQGFVDKFSREAGENLNNEELVQSGRGLNLTTHHSLVPKLRKTPP